MNDIVDLLTVPLTNAIEAVDHARLQAVLDVYDQQLAQQEVQKQRVARSESDSTDELKKNHPGLDLKISRSPLDRIDPAIQMYARGITSELDSVTRQLEADFIDPQQKMNLTPQVQTNVAKLQKERAQLAKSVNETAAARASLLKEQMAAVEDLVVSSRNCFKTSSISTTVST